HNPPRQQGRKGDEQHRHGAAPGPTTHHTPGASNIGAKSRVVPGINPLWRRRCGERFECVKIPDRWLGRRFSNLPRCPRVPRSQPPRPRPPRRRGIAVPPPPPPCPPATPHTTPPHGVTPLSPLPGVKNVCFSNPVFDLDGAIKVTHPRHEQ